MADWQTTKLDTESDVMELLVELRCKGWLSRGQSRAWNALLPTIDRPPYTRLSRKKKLDLERRSIEVFRSTARFFSSPGEQQAVLDDFSTLMVLRHYGVPTRLLDWSASPYVAMFFAVSEQHKRDGELWAFSYLDYEAEGKKQWREWPDTTTDDSGDDDKFAAGLTAFSTATPPNWVVAAFYPSGFPRQNAQKGLYTLTARFRIDHADALRRLLVNESRFHRYVVKARIKEAVTNSLQANHGIWRGSLFPDSAGAAATAGESFATKIGAN